MGSARLGIKNALSLMCAVLTTGCPPTADPVSRLLDPPHLAVWQPAGIPGEGKIQVTAEGISIGVGKPMSGVKFTAWQPPAFPVTDYSIEYDAKRLDGRDIFGMLTFPVGDAETHATFVLGGWGGTVTGISNIDFSDANENQTRGELPFENDRWYHVKVEVRPGTLRAWIDERLVVNVSIRGRHISLRPGYADHCRPFGFATWGTRAAIRDVTVTRLRPEL